MSEEQLMLELDHMFKTCDYNGEDDDILTDYDFIFKNITDLQKEIARLNKIIETLDLYFKYMVDDRDFDKVSQLSDRAFNEYITLSIVEDYYKLVKEEPDEQLKEIKEQIKKEEGKE